MAFTHRVSLLLIALFVLGPGLHAQQVATPVVALTPEQMEAFLLKAPIIREKGTKKGVTNTIQATLSDGVITHDAQIQTVNEEKHLFQAGRATEINFRDSYRYNIAGYRLAQLVGLKNVPMSVKRMVKGKDAAVTWWIDDVQFDEQGRLKLKSGASGPDPQRTSKQTQVMRVWDELIQNRDRNQGNIVWTTDWTMWLIDHTRAFRMNDKLLKPEQLTRVERSFYEGMKALTVESVTKAMDGILTREEIAPILKRRDAIVAHFEKRIAERGEAAVLFDM